jgi:hypothetical protein
LVSDNSRNLSTRRSPLDKSTGDLRAATNSALIVADGTSCRHPIGDGTKRSAIHVARVLESRWRFDKSSEESRLGFYSTVAECVRLWGR